MRPSQPRRLPAKPAELAKRPADAGDHLDLGITVSVYCAETARRLQARDGTETPADFTEH